MVDMRVGNKPDTFTGTSEHWTGWSFKMRQYISALDEQMHAELLVVDGDPITKRPLSEMTLPTLKRARTLAFILTLFTKDNALEMVAKLEEPTNGFEVWRRFLEEWEPAHRGRFRAMLTSILNYTFPGDRGKALDEWERMIRQYEAQAGDRLQDSIKSAVLSGQVDDVE